MKKILPLFSYLFHPIFVPVFGSLCYFLLNENYLISEQKCLILIQVSITMIFIPISVFYLLRTIGKADSVMLSDVSQRKIPLFVQALLIVVLVGQSITHDKIPELYFFFLGGLASTLSAFILSLVKIKASLHMTGISTLVFFVIGLSMHNHINAIYLISFLFLIVGIVAASRLQMQAHNGKELLIGFLSGMLPQIAFWFFWL